MVEDVPDRRATRSDLDTVVDIVTLAFATDPLWSWALARPDGGTGHHRQFWRLFVEGALRYPETWITGGDQATAVWLPPGATEMTEREEVALEALVEEHLGPGAHARYFGLLARFEDAHPHDEEHFYLSLLGTHPDHRGQGIGTALLARNLADIDAAHANAYLESSNPANNQRYQRLGFEVRGGFEAPGDGPVVTTMWRPAR